MKKIIIIVILLISTYAFAMLNIVDYSIMDGKSKATSYLFNKERSFMPAYLRIPAEARSTNLTVTKDGQKSIAINIKNDVNGWYINDNFLTLPGAPVGLTVDFSTGKVYQIPNALNDKIVKALTVDNRLSVKNVTATKDKPSDLELVFVDSVVLTSEKIDRFPILIGYIKETPADFIPTMPEGIDHGINLPEGVVVKDRPLLTAAANGQMDLVNKLLSNGSNINETDPANGDNALMKAIRANNEDASLMLIDLGINTKYTNSSKQSALHLASEKGYFNLAKRLVSNNNINSKDVLGNTPLMYAAVSPNPFISELLVNRGASLNEVNNDGKTALALAAYNGNTKNVQYLISKGANMQSKDKNGNSVLMQAVKGGNIYITKILLENGNKDINTVDNKQETPLHNSILMGDNAMADLLIDSGANVNVRDANGNTPIILASSKGNRPIVQKLMGASADIYIANNKGMTAYDVAKDNSDIKKIFRDKIMEKEEMSNSLFLLIAENKQEELMKQIEKGAEVNVVDLETGNTPIFAAVANNNKDILSFLIKSKANINIQNKRGNTPLMVSVSAGDEKTVEMLIKAGAELNTQNLLGDTALIWAVKLQREDITRMLLVNGAKPNIKNFEGISPLNIAQGENMKGIEKLLRSFGAF